MRTKACRKLLESTCTEVISIIIDGAHVWIDTWGQKDVFRRGVQLTAHERDELACADGFKDYAEMEAWFEATHTMPVRGQLIRW